MFAAALHIWRLSLPSAIPGHGFANEYINL
jgi:hypothetical protein